MRFLADEDFDHRVVRGLIARMPEIDLVLATEVGLGETSDPDVLAWAARNGRVVLTRDVNTMTGFAYERVTAGLPMPGMVAVPDHVPIGQVIDEILLLVGAGRPDELNGQVAFIPL